MKRFYVAFSRWKLLMGGYLQNADPFFYELCPWWELNHGVFNQSCIANRWGDWEYHPVKGWQQQFPF